MSIYRRTLLVVIVAAIALSSACATSRKVQIVQIGDDKLTCDQILQEMAKLDQMQADVDKKRGVTGTNVAAFLFFVPGLAYTFYDAHQAEKFISERRDHLTTLYTNKTCG